MADTFTDSGVVVVDKPQGWTSHQVVGRLRRILGTRKVGHAGTLDPMATGVLVIGVNRATRLLGYVSGHDKTYTATIRLGQSSATDDAEGALGEVTPATHLPDAEIETAMAAFRGPIDQVPSTVSAIKVNGQRAHAMVRRGEEVVLSSRRVTVTRFERLSRHDDAPFCDLDVVVDCSSGTYIRALARDLGRSLGVGGHLTALRRTRVGGFHLPDSPMDLEADLVPSLMSMVEVARRCFSTHEVDAAQTADVSHGRPLELDLPGLTALLHGDTLLALHEPDPQRRGRTRPVAVLS